MLIDRSSSIGTITIDACLTLKTIKVTLLTLLLIMISLTFTIHLTTSNMVEYRKSRNYCILLIILLLKTFSLGWGNTPLVSLRSRMIMFILGSKRESYGSTLGMGSIEY